MKLIFMNIIILFIKEEKIKEEDNRHCFKSLIVSLTKNSLDKRHHSKLNLYVVQVSTFMCLYSYHMNLQKY